MKCFVVFFLFVRVACAHSFAYLDIDSLHKSSPQVILALCIESKNTEGKVKEGVLHYTHDATFSVVDVLKGDYEGSFVEYSDPRLKIVDLEALKNGGEDLGWAIDVQASKVPKLEPKEFYLLYRFGPGWHCCKLTFYNGGRLPLSIETGRESKVRKLLKERG